MESKVWNLREASGHGCSIYRTGVGSHVTTHTPATHFGRQFRDVPSGLVAGSSKLRKSSLRRRPREGGGTGSQNESEMNDLVISN